MSLDALARKIGIEPNDLRFKSLVQPHHPRQIELRARPQLVVPRRVRHRHRAHQIQKEGLPCPVGTGHQPKCAAAISNPADVPD